MTTILLKKRITIILDNDLITKLHQIQSLTIEKTNSSVSLSSVISEIIEDRVNNSHPEIRNIAAKTIEKTLSSLGKKTKQDIGRKLYQKHQVYFADYCDNPKHLVDVLNDEFGPSHTELIKKIDNNLKEYL